MKHRRLKSVPLRTKAELTTIHDRRATELPANALVAVGLRDDPYERGAKISVALSLKGDPLLSLHVRGMIADYQFAAGREWQRHFEMAQIDGMKSRAAVDPVDGGGFTVEFLTDAKRKAIAKLVYCRAILGETGNAIVTLVLGGNLPIQQAALARGMVTRREIEYVGQRFRESLGELARVFGYA
jgi:hypothetical protein